nr:hypothetical protein [uncultured Flavobacterium sp.]
MKKKILISLILFSLFAKESNAQTSTQVVSTDSRDMNYLPLDRNSGAYFDFKSNSADGLFDSNNFHGVLTFRPYGGAGDFTGGLAHQLAFTDNGNMWLRSGSNATWLSWNKIYSNKNLNRFDVDFNAQNIYANGNLWAKEIKVALTNPWPDFVFESGYKLKSLADLELFIKENRHLPEIPKESEVGKNGLNIGEMQSKLLQKIEELTLYIIEQNKKSEKQEQELKLLKADIKKIKSNKK